MIDYTGINCPVCGTPFHKDDDIVVCPECGAPYHRECYARSGKCIFSDKHSSHTAWTPPEPEPKVQHETEAEEEAKAKTKRCPRCGNINSQDAMFCDRCGLSLTMNQQDFSGFPKNGGSPPNGFPPPPPGNPYPGPGQPIPFVFDPMGGVNPNEPIDNVPAGDVAKLVQNNTQYYLPTFMNIKRFRRNRFNFSAFLFTGGWLLYRKQYKIGAIITTVMTVLYMISTYIRLHFTLPLLETLLQQQGIQQNFSTLTYEQLRNTFELFVRQPVSQILLFNVPTIISIIEFIIMLVVGFNANKWYLKHCVHKVNQIHEEAPEATHAAIQYQEQGGVNTSIAIFLMICYMIVAYLPSIIF